MKWRRRDYPRPTTAEAKREAAYLLRFAAVLSAVGVVPLLVFAAMWAPDRRLAAAPTADAQVMEVLQVRRLSRGLPDTSAVRVRFSVPGHGEVETTVRTTRRSVGKSIKVTYDSDNPERVRAVSGPEQAWRVPLIIALSFFAVALLGVWYAIRLWIGRPSRLYLKNRTGARST